MNTSQMGASLVQSNVYRRCPLNLIARGSTLSYVVWIDYCDFAHIKRRVMENNVMKQCYDYGK